MKKLVVIGTVVLGLTGSAHAQPLNEGGRQCVEENARLQAAASEAQNLMLNKIILQSQVTLLQQQVKALQEEKKASQKANPKEESAAQPAPAPETVPQ